MRTVCSVLLHLLLILVLDIVYLHEGDSVVGVPSVYSGNLLESYEGRGRTASSYEVHGSVNHKDIGCHQYHQYWYEVAGK